MNMFMTMGTNEHETLVEQFMQVIVDAQQEVAVFFLEANNWSLPDAISSYMEQSGGGGQFQVSEPFEAEFVCDITVGEGEEIPPNVEFQKTWRLRNIGMHPWPESCTLQFVRGEQMNAPNFVHVTSIDSGAEIDISVTMKSPREVGNYASSWRLCHNEGALTYFGEEIWVVITVAVGGMLGVTQQLHGTTFAETSRPPAFHQTVRSTTEDGSVVNSALHPHPLVFYEDSNPWVCSSRFLPGGCMTQQLFGVPRYICSMQCEFAICMDCVQLGAVAFDQTGGLQGSSAPPSLPFTFGSSTMSPEGRSTIPKFGSLATHSFGNFGFGSNSGQRP